MTLLLTGSTAPVQSDNYQVATLVQHLPAKTLELKIYIYVRSNNMCIDGYIDKPMLESQLHVHGANFMHSGVCRYSGEETGINQRHPRPCRDPFC